MCQISKETVIRANCVMIERKHVRQESEAAPDSTGSFSVSVFANGRLYSQTVTKAQISEAFGEALKETKVPNA